MRRIRISTDYFAIRYYAGGTWTVYHVDRPRQAVWEAHELSDCVAWVRAKIGR